MSMHHVEAQLHLADKVYHVHHLPTMTTDCCGSRIIICAGRIIILFTQHRSNKINAFWFHNTLL